MALIRIDRFGGLIPKLDEKRLPENCAVEAINVDLQGMGIEPVYAHLFKREVEFTSSASMIRQIPTACLRTRGFGGTAYTRVFISHTVVADDYLIYAVYLPSDAVPLAGQGCVNLKFTDLSLLGNVLDEDGVGSRDGQLTAAQGVWLVRAISLASVVGKTTTEMQFLHNYVGERDAYLGFAFIHNTGVFSPKVIFDVDFTDTREVTEVAASGTSLQELTLIDEDEAPLISADAVEIRGVLTVAQTQFAGSPRNKAIVTGKPIGVKGNGWSNRDRFRSYDTFTSFGVVYRHQWKGTYNAITLSETGNNGKGWISVYAPLAAMSLAVVGGAAPTVTRSYVYTRVSEDGLESGPSPAVTVTGNRDGTWQLTAIDAWPYGGTDSIAYRANPPVKRIYRTPEGSSTYRFVGEIADSVTTLNDLALDSALGEELPTADYDSIPRYPDCAAPWINGLVGFILEGTQVIFCEPYQYHAWPIAYRYTLPTIAVAVGTVGDRFIALTATKPVAFTGASPDQLVQTELPQGEACLSVKGVVQSDVGILYPGKTGWNLVDYSGVQNITKEFLSAADYSAIVGIDTVAMFDNRKLHWITQAGTTGYSFEFGAQERSLTKFELPDSVYAMSYYAPRDTRWIAYRTLGAGNVKMGKLFGDTSQKLKWTWKSKLIRLPKPGTLKVAQIDSNEWDNLSDDMKYREGFHKTVPAWVTATAYLVGDFVTNGGDTYRCAVAHTAGTFAVDLAAVKWVLANTAYTITITGLTQAESWVYLKVWCEADKGDDKILVYDDFVVSDRPVYLARAMKSDCWQFEIRGNMAISSIALASSERELNAE